MNITITINAPELASAIQSLAQALSGHSFVATTAATAASAEAPQEEKPKRSRTTKQEEPEAPQKEVPKVGTEEEPAPAPTGNVPTVVELRAKAQEVGKTPEAKKAIKALLDQYGSKSISDVPEEKRADFLADLDLI